MVAKKKVAAKKPAAAPVMVGVDVVVLQSLGERLDKLEQSQSRLLSTNSINQLFISALAKGLEPRQRLAEQVDAMGSLRRQIESQLAGAEHNDDQVDAIRHGVGHGLSGGSSSNDYDPRFVASAESLRKQDRANRFAKEENACEAVRPGPQVNMACDRLEGDLNLVMELVQVLVNRLDPVLRPSDPQPTTGDCYESSGVPLVDRLSRSSQNLRQVSETLTSALSRLELP